MSRHGYIHYAIPADSPTPPTLVATRVAKRFRGIEFTAELVATHDYGQLWRMHRKAPDGNRHDTQAAVARLMTALGVKEAP